MKKIGFQLFLFVAYGFARLPVWLLYGLTGFIRFMLHQVLGYRRKVVRQNLRNSFPDNSPEQLKKTEKEFYNHLAELFTEYIKMLQVSKKELKEFVEFTNPEVIANLHAQGKSVFLAAGHCGNWELLSKRICDITPHHSMAIYKQLSNPYFDQLVKDARERLDTLELIESKTAYRSLARKNNQLNSVIIVADQSPAGNEMDYWTTFLHQDTAFFNGIEKMAKALDYAVVYLESKRVRRGHYEVTASLITAEPKLAAENEITHQYAQMLEQSIRHQPANWLWSHRRWKHQRPQTPQA